MQKIVMSAGSLMIHQLLAYTLATLWCVCLVDVLNFSKQKVEVVLKTSNCTHGNMQFGTVKV